MHSQTSVVKSATLSSLAAWGNDAAFVFATGPAASETMRKRYEHIPTQVAPQRQ
ncbi:hypothetical protein AB0C19_18060 [Micromonospora sp. NPDC048842]|uniref:hypothetical protein n=1 Tax=Micromonospora sp. NPDC048842 TaxID=3154346 RepID=UPI0033F8102B